MQMVREMVEIVFEGDWFLGFLGNASTVTGG